MMLLGNLVVFHETNHKMRLTGQYVNDRFIPGDEIVSLDVFTYFDFSYYNHTGTTTKLYGPGINVTYNEPGLLAGQPQLRITNLSRIDPASGRVWIIGKTGSHDYYKEIPTGWQLVREHDAGYTEARLYKL